MNIPICLCLYYCIKPTLLRCELKIESASDLPIPWLSNTKTLPLHFTQNLSSITIRPDMQNPTNPHYLIGNCFYFKQIYRCIITALDLRLPNLSGLFLFSFTALQSNRAISIIFSFRILRYHGESVIVFGLKKRT